MSIYQPSPLHNKNWRYTLMRDRAQKWFHHHVVIDVAKVAGRWKALVHWKGARVPQWKTFSELLKEY